MSNKITGHVKLATERPAKEYRKVYKSEDKPEASENKAGTQRTHRDKGKRNRHRNPGAAGPTPTKQQRN